jgi:opacity protein-like surface antigen
MKMRTMMLALAAATFLVVPALASDVNAPAQVAITKAITKDPCIIASASTPLSCSGFYVGGGLSGEGSNADIIGSGINGSVFAGGMTPTFDAGYQYAKGNWFFGAELDVGYALGANTSIGATNSNLNGFRTTEFFKVGGNLSGLLGTQTPITIPASLQNAVIAPYVGVGPAQWWLANGEVTAATSGAGVMFDIGPKWIGDLRYTYTNFNGAKSNGLSLQNDQSLMVLLSYKLN